MSKNKMESGAKNMAAMNDSHSDVFGFFFEGWLFEHWSLRALVCKNQTNSKFRGKGEKFDFFLILILDRLDYN